MIIDVDSILPDRPALIICLPTGIKYTAQTGGIGCDHPEAEGILLSLSPVLEDFDDCSYGCSHLWEMEVARLKLADDLDTFFIDKNYNHIKIDRERLTELAEGWWPVIYSLSMGGVPGPFKGYIHTGNCD